MSIDTRTLAPASCSSRFAASGSTAPTSRRRRSRRARPASSCRAERGARRASRGRRPVDARRHRGRRHDRRRCRRWRTRFGANRARKVVAITGSAGKTTTKEVTAEFLAARYRVVRNRGNFNNHIGLPLSLIELRQRPEIAVVELGMNHAGEISTLVRVAEPDVRVWTNVGEAHLGFFASLDAIADAKAEILEGATRVDRCSSPTPTTTGSRRGPRRLPGRVVTFGIDRAADVRASRDRRSRHRRHERPRHDAAGHVRDDDAAGRARATWRTSWPRRRWPSSSTCRSRRSPSARDGSRPAAHRGEIVRLPSGVTIIDDSYNANPTATRQALDVLARDARGDAAGGRARRDARARRSRHRAARRRSAAPRRGRRSTS